LDCVQDILRSTLGDSSSSLAAAMATVNNNTAAAGEDALASSASAFAIGGASRVELYHVALGFFTYINTHTTLERMGTDAASIAEIQTQHPSPSFVEAVQFGVTRGNLPRAPLPASCTGFFAEAAPSSARSSVTAASTTKGGAHDERPFSSESVYLRAALHELTLFLGYVCLGESSIQEIFSWGKNRPLLSTMLNGLPMQYYAQCRHVLFPTLLAIADHDNRNQLLLAREMDKDSLIKFLEEEYQLLPGKMKTQAQSVAKEAADPQTPASPPPTPVSGPAAVPAAPHRNWADDDEDDDCWFGVPPPKAKAATGTPAAAAPPVEVPLSAPKRERERLVRLLRQNVTPLSLPAAISQYRFERRFPPALWLAALESLKEGVAPEMEAAPTA